MWFANVFSTFRRQNSVVKSWKLVGDPLAVAEASHGTTGTVVNPAELVAVWDSVHCAAAKRYKCCLTRNLDAVASAAVYVQNTYNAIPLSLG